MVHFLQKRKYRLVVLWRTALKQAPGFQVPAALPFPYVLIFGAFQELIRMLRVEETPDKATTTLPGSILDSLGAEAVPGADQYMEMFLTGRDVLDAFIAEDPVFCERFPRGERQALREALTRATKELIEREMRAYAERAPANLEPAGTVHRPTAR